MAEAEEVAFDLEEAVAEIAVACRLPRTKVQAAAQLLAEGNTIPFIARYRKERTGALDEAALRAIEDAIGYSRELAERKNTILKTIQEQGKADSLPLQNTADAYVGTMLRTSGRKTAKVSVYESAASSYSAS